MKIGKVNLKWQDIDMTQLELDKLILHFAQSNKAEGKSPKTVAWYGEMLSGFVKFLRSRGRNAILNDFNALTVREFIIHEQGRKVSPYTVQTKVRALKAFSSWLFAEGYISSNLLTIIKLPKVPIKMVEPLTTAEIDKLITTQNPLTAIGCRNLAILITLLDTGLRATELCNLHLEDAHIDEGYLKVMGKGNKERIVPIGALAQKVLWRYVFHFKPGSTDKEQDYIILTLDGKHLQPNAVKLLLKRWGRTAGVPRLHAHLCRHTFATNFLVHKCGDVFRLQQILGHSTLEMVRRYIHYASARAMIQEPFLSPMDHLGVKGISGYKIERALKRKCGM